MIKFENVTKYYQGVTKAVDNVSFVVPRGETVVLLGPSGCGKTTLLRMVNQLESITEGSIFVDERDVSKVDKVQLRRDIGYVIQSVGLFPNMTIEENVVVVPDLLGWDKARKKARYLELMELVGLDPELYRHRYPHELSGGQRQRIGIIRALAADPPVMLMDEPFSALDPVLRTRLQDEFLRIQKGLRKTVLFVSHDIDEALKMGDKIAILNEGKLMQYGTPLEILMHPNSHFVRHFVGQDRVLKALSLHTVHDFLQVNQLEPIGKSTKTSQYIPTSTNLRSVLSTLLSHESEQVIVTDEENNPLGVITLEKINLYLQKLTTLTNDAPGGEQWTINA